jgi:hypothetical protein
LGKPDWKTFGRDVFCLPMQTGIVVILILFAILIFVAELIFPQRSKNGWGDIL